METSQGHDWISNLPDELLVSIVSRLPMDEAAATGILSTRWRNTWRSQHHLDFNPRKMTSLGREFSFMIENGELDYSRSYSQFFNCSHEKADAFSEDVRNEFIRATSSIEAILESHPYDIRSCRIVHFGHNLEHGQVQRWIQCLKDKGIGELILTIDEESLVPSLGQIRYTAFNLPKGTFECATLKVLELRRYWDLSVDPFVGCKNLRKLRLHEVQQINSDVLQKIIRSCEFLEELSMSRCPGFIELNISSEHLKVLELRFLVLVNINIQSESLEVMVLDELSCCRDSMVINAPNIISLRTEHCTEEHNRERIPEKLLLESKNLLGDSINAMKNGTGNISSFNKLQDLSIRCDLNYEEDAEVLTKIFQEFKCVVNLNIINRVELFWLGGAESQSVIPKNLHKLQDKLEGLAYSLQKVSITGFRGDPLACTFARSFVSNARYLREFNVDCGDSCSEEQRNQMLWLMSIPKASPSLSIVVKHGTNC